MYSQFLRNFRKNEILKIRRLYKTFESKVLLKIRETSVDKIGAFSLFWESQNFGRDSVFVPRDSSIPSQQILSTRIKLRENCFVINIWLCKL